ncbi:hypothetical protein [Herbaspirillum sp. NPDC087042]|uniref:hypothetical protein n=1 Tax=Herbaspirillum sp. NPDC087042 TaxID=3364004 RepID=UPI003830F836
MLSDYAEDIASRYMQFIGRQADLAERGELVGDLVRSAVRGCLIAMQAAGAEPEDVRLILGDLITEHIGQLHVGQNKARWVLGAVRHHMEFLLFLEENNERTKEHCHVQGQASGLH